MKKLLIEKLGGYTTVEDALNSIESEEEKHKLLTKAVVKHFNTITEDDIFRKDGVNYTYKGKPLMDAQVESLRNQAKSLLESELFKMLELELQYQANLKMYRDSKDIIDLISGKLILWTWKVIKSRLHNI